MIIAMANAQPESTVRRLTCTGKYDMDDFDVAFDKNTFQYRLLTGEQKAAVAGEKRERELLKWAAEGVLRKHRYKAAELDSLAERGLLVKEGGVWRATTADEQAQTGMGQ